jgi:hypothetical protein
MARSTRNIGTRGNKIEQVAGKGLLHRRALLERGAAFAGAFGAGAELNAIFYFEIMSPATALSRQSNQETGHGA